jgi:predicted phosphoribosyltransferase
MLFNDRVDAGKQLALRLKKYLRRKDGVVLGLTRGGVVTAEEIAIALQLPLDVIVVRKMGAPENPELAIGAVAERGEGVLNDHLIELLGVSHEYLTAEAAREKEIVKQRLALYRGGRKPLELHEKIVILVDDGIATGASMQAAITSVRESGAKQIVLAVPVAAPESLKKIRQEVDEVVCLASPAFFEAVGSFYRVFDQTSDEEIIQILARYSRPNRA